MSLHTSARKPPNIPRRNEEGYVLLTMLLVLSLMAIAATAILPAVNYQLKRDQETEMIHRGVQYSRAIKTYFKKFGRYPTRLEDLDNTNNLRYLRKHYKDPLTGKDFRLLHYGEQGVTMAGGLGGGSIPGANPVGGLNASAGSNSAFGNSSFGNSSSVGSGSSNSGFGSSGVNSNGIFSQTSSFGGNSNGGFGASSNSQGTSGRAANNGDTDPSQSSTGVKGTGQGDEASSGQQLVIGGAIVGVASTSKKTGLHEFNHKKKFSEWQFVYDPTMDRGGLIQTPYQPSLQGFGSAAGMGQGITPAGQSGSSGQSSFGQSSFGQSSFGQSGFGQSGFGQSSSGFNNNQNNNQNPMSPPQQPPSSPPQQQ
jgi:type II secretory pathway pseudopilin PulG